MSLRPILKPVFFALALLPVSAVVSASPGGGHRAPPDPPRASARQHDSIRQRDADALSDSVRRIERSTRGQVLSAERVPYDGRDVNRIKTVDEHGRVRVYMDDPRRPQPQDPPPAD